MGKSFLVADFYYWISGVILHDGFETVVKKGDRPCFKFFGFYMIVVGWVVAIVGYFSK